MQKFIYTIVFLVLITLQLFSQKKTPELVYNVYDNVFIPSNIKSKKVIRNYKISDSVKVKCQVIKAVRKDVACPIVSKNSHEGLGVFEWIGILGDGLRKEEPCIDYSEFFRITILNVDTSLTFADIAKDTAGFKTYTLGAHFFVQEGMDENSSNFTTFPLNIYIKRTDYEILFYFQLPYKEWIIIKTTPKDAVREDLRILADLLDGSYTGDILFRVNTNQYIRLKAPHNSYYKFF